MMPSSARGFTGLRACAECRVGQSESTTVVDQPLRYSPGPEHCAGDPMPTIGHLRFDSRSSDRLDGRDIRAGLEGLHRAELVSAGVRPPSSVTFDLTPMDFPACTYAVGGGAATSQRKKRLRRVSSLEGGRLPG